MRDAARDIIDKEGTGGRRRRVRTADERAQSTRDGRTDGRSRSGPREPFVLPPRRRVICVGIPVDGSQQRRCRVLHVPLRRSPVPVHHAHQLHPATAVAAHSARVPHDRGQPCGQTPYDPGKHERDDGYWKNTRGKKKHFTRAESGGTTIVRIRTQVYNIMLSFSTILIKTNEKKP